MYEFLIVCSGLLAIVYFIYRFLYAPYQVLKRCGIKGPTPVPFFGNYREIVKMKARGYYEYLTNKYGTVCGFYIGQRPQILISDLDILKEVLVKDFSNFIDRPYFPDLLRKKSSSARGLLSSRGDYWKFSRHLLSPSFSSSKMRMMVPLVNKSVATLVERLEQQTGTGKSLEFFKTYSSFTMETILATAFGRVVDIQRGESDDLTKAVDSIFRRIQEGSSFDQSVLILLMSNLPWILPLLRFILSGSSRGEKFSILQNTALNLVKIRRESNLERPGKYKDLLQLMLDASGEEDSSPAGEEGQEGGEEGGTAQTPADEAMCPVKKTDQVQRKLTDEEVVAHAVTFILAGYETTANTLAYTSYLLALNPHIQEKLQSEIDNYFDDKPGASNYEASQEITYLDNVIQESLRLYPPAPRISRECKKTTTIKGVTIPKRSTVMIPIFLLQTDPQYWNEPEKFDPDRFTADEKAKRPQLCHMPFGYGPRSCIGMRFAMLEAKIALIELLKRFSFVRAPDTEVPLQTVFGITMAPKNGIYLKIVHRT